MLLASKRWQNHANEPVKQLIFHVYIYMSAVWRKSHTKRSHIPAVTNAMSNYSTMEYFSNFIQVKVALKSCPLITAGWPALLTGPTCIPTRTHTHPHTTRTQACVQDMKYKRVPHNTVHMHDKRSNTRTLTTPRNKNSHQSRHTLRATYITLNLFLLGEFIETWRREENQNKQTTQLWMDKFSLLWNLQS